MQDQQVAEGVDGDEANLRAVLALVRVIAPRPPLL
jgi:hypothetical protein